MFEHIENLKLIDVMEAWSSLYRVYTGRFSHGFVFKINGESKYTFGHTAIHHKEGEMLFIPKGSSYTVERLSEEESKYVVINFDAELTHAAPKKYHLAHLIDMQFISTQMARRWLFQSPSDRYECISTFYHVLSVISRLDKTEYLPKQKIALIEPAVRYLEEHIFDCSLKVGDLHLLCGVSDTYFRKIFISQFGTGPQNYITNKRLTQANTMLNTGDYNRISDVALAVGYEDPLYFSKIFRDRYGLSPSRTVSQSKSPSAPRH
ncbi:MAG: helix-turn-helix transcriptional regulator [Lachnospiraceae bacterium]|nr:helix-turn-helix transcriptional regulator [Lachnospiraceae bacterium]